MNKEKMYSMIKKKLENVVRNSSGLKILKFDYAGSRKNRTHKINSDLDLQFTVEDDPSKAVVYPKVVKAIKLIPKYRVSIGKEENIVNIWGDGFTIDLALSENK